MKISRSLIPIVLLVPLLAFSPNLALSQNVAAYESDSFPEIVRDDRDAIEFATNFFNTRQQDLLKLINGEKVELVTFRQGPTTADNLELLLSFLTGYSLRLSSLKVSKVDKSSCDQKIADEIKGKARFGKGKQLEFRLSRQSGLIFEKPPEDRCTCTPSRFGQEVEWIARAMTNAARSYCRDFRGACQGISSNAREFPNDVFRSLKRIVGGSDRGLVDLGVRCQDVFNGVVARAMAQLSRENRVFACVRLAETITMKSGESFGSSFGGGNHVFPTLVPFRFTLTPNNPISIGDRSLADGTPRGVLLSASQQTPADPELSSLYSKLLVDYFDPWRGVEQGVGAGRNPQESLRGRDLFYLNPYPWWGQCEQRLQQQREYDKSQERPFDPTCYARKFPALNGRFGSKDGALALDKEYYCKPSKGTEGPYKAVCPNAGGGNTGGGSKPPPPGSSNLCTEAQDDLPICNNYSVPSPDSPLVQQAVTGAQCFYGSKMGGVDLCRIPKEYMGSNPCWFTRWFSLTGDEDYTSYYYFVPSECKDLSDEPVSICSLVVHLPGENCPADNGNTPSPNPGSGGCEGRNCG